MIRFLAPVLLLGLPCLPAAQAQLFPRGPDALRYGPYTGGHAYSYNTAYGYGLSFSPADSWYRDPFAYPAGIYPYRPFERPITYRVFPHSGTAYVSVPGPNGLPILIPQAVECGPPPVGAVVAPGLLLVPVPTAADGRVARIHVIAPAGAEVWVEKQKLPGAAATYRTPPLTPGKMEVYSVRAKWTVAGREVEQFRVVGVNAGDTKQVQFTAGTR